MISISKTKTMNPDNAHINLGDQIVENVKKDVYLSQSRKTR